MALNFQDRDIEDKFKKLSFTEAQCKSCSNTFTHTYIDEFRTHVETHKEIVEKEKLLPSTPSAKYIRYNQEESRYQCVLCKKNVEIESEHCSTHHIHEENEYALMRTFYEEWQLKYCETQQEEDSEIKCYICQTKISIDFRKNYLMYHIREYHIKHSPQDLKDIKLCLSVETLKHFENFSNNKAECKTCNMILVHTTMTHFRNHIKIHKDVFNFENQIQSTPSSKYIKYCRNREYQCVLCEKKTTKDCENHIHANDEFTSIGKHYKEWELKYCERINRSKIKCNFCSQSIKVKYNSTILTKHRQECKSKTEDMNKLYKNYKILSQYYNTVQCKHCNTKHQYINIINLHLHLMELHPHIIELNNQNPDISCRNLKYLNKKHYVCNICYQLVPSATLLDHECKDDNKDTEAVGDNWLWKYFIQINDFMAECAVCTNTKRYQYKIFTYYLDMHIKACITRRQEMWKFFKQDDEKSLSKVRCTLCTQSEEFIKYADINMSNHIRDYHPVIFEFETEDEQSLELRKYIIKYEDNDGLHPYMCIFCESDLILEKEFEIHRHKDEEKLHHLYYDDWPWKYCTKWKNGSVKCDICTEDMEIKYDLSLLENHLETYHPSQEKYLKRTYDDILLAL